MSELFRIRIESVLGPTVRARFNVCHPDQWDVPATKTFSLLTIVEIFRNMKHGYGYPCSRVEIVEDFDEAGCDDRQPLSEQSAKDLIAAHPHRTVLERWTSLYDEFNAPPFIAEAEEAIAEVHLEDETDNPKRNEGDPFPCATLVFTVKDASTIFHVVDGVHFHSAMCDCRYW